MRGAVQVMKNMEDDDDVDLKQKMKEIEESLEAKEELSRVLTVKHWRNNDELQDACKELIKTFKENTTGAQICVKRMGELDSKPFLIAAKKYICCERSKSNGRDALF